MNGYFVELLPNIYWFYIYKNTNTIKSSNVMEIQNNIKKFHSYKNIQQVIRLDDDTKFWLQNKNYSEEIKGKIREIENQKLLNYFHQKIKEIKILYVSGKSVLIISNNNIDTAIGLFILLFKIFANMDCKHSILSIQSKVKTPITIGADMKYFIKTVFS